MIHTLNCLLPFYALPCLQLSRKDNVSQNTLQMFIWLYPVLPCNSDTKNTLTSTLLHTVFFIRVPVVWQDTRLLKIRVPHLAQHAHIVVHVNQFLTSSCIRFYVPETMTLRFKTKSGAVMYNNANYQHLY